ncbi:MAG: hypothetical protein C5B48_04730 [Candidatus Rokuibacteriota bacterium]|nr:MAG: hypothetical protein C5B48_04730 [Candidatus Rokubacteria bacterium]
MTRRALLPLLIVVLVASAAVASRAPVVAPGAAELLRHVDALTAPEMEGRASGTAGGDRASHYIAERLAAAGLAAGGDAQSFLQWFVVSTVPEVASDSVLEHLGPERKALALGSDWRPHGGSLGAERDGEIVFVGYGVVAPDRGWDDYAGIEVHDKIALALDGAPGRLGEPPPSRLEKLIAAHRRGAGALLIIGDALPSPAATSAAVRIVSGALTPAAADLLLEPSGKTTAQLRATLAHSDSPRSFATGAQARLRVNLTHEDRRGANVIGILRGTDPARAAEAVVLGAHYDHLGLAGGSVHPGADDNASGTAVVLSLARALSAAGGTPRTLVFALFGGEEAGLLGSAHYVRHPAMPIDRTIAMVNLDMVGRMRDRRLNVGGVESGAGLRALLTSAAGDHLNLVLHDSPFSPSDHTSFYGAGTPVLFFFTDGHDDYHTPRDTADKINAEGMSAVAAMAARVVERLANEPRPAYVKLSPPERSPRVGGVASGSTFLGVSADGRDESDGLRLSSVLSDTAAARAGLRSGDIIVRLGGQPINRFEELKRTIEGKRPGDTVAVLYLRDGEAHEATAILGARP